MPHANSGNFKTNKKFAKLIRRGFPDSAKVVCEVEIGNFNIINSNITIEHETIIGNNNFIVKSEIISKTLKPLLQSADRAGYFIYQAETRTKI